MQISRKTIRLNTVCAGLVLLAGVIRLLVRHTGLFSYNSIIFTLFSAASAIWIFQLKTRILQPEVRRNLIGAAFLMIFWMAVRTLKYDFLPPGHFTARYAWYMYYIPMLFIPLLMFLSVLTIGRPHNKTICRRWYLLFVPTCVIFAGIITNDLHQTAFRFNDGIVLWTDYDVTRGFVYYAAMTWIAVLFIAMLFIVLIRCAVPEKRRLIWAPLLPLLAGVIYTICIVLDIRILLTKMLRAPEMGCFLFAAFMEALICVRLFPNNDNYETFWRISSIGAGIMDNDGSVCCKSEKSICVTPEQVKRALGEAVFLDKGRYRLKSHAVSGGYGYWIRDISEIKRLNDELEELGNVTAEENAILEAENKIREERLRIEEQNRLYDDMARGVKKQLDTLNRLLGAPDEDEAEFEKMMKYACILNAYIKRHSNLILISHQDAAVHSEEVRRAVEESLEYVRLCGIKAQCFCNGKARLSAAAALFAYETFEAVLESSIPGADNILVYLNVYADTLKLCMEINAPGEVFSDRGMIKRAAALGGMLETETEEFTEYVTLELPAGGDKR